MSDILIKRGNLTLEQISAVFVNAFCDLKAEDSFSVFDFLMRALKTDPLLIHRHCKQVKDTDDYGD